MKNMNSQSWIAIECLALLGILGIASFFKAPSYENGVFLIIGALIATLSQAQGAKTGSKMPEQVGDVKPGQATQSKTITETQSTDPPPVVPSDTPIAPKPDA